MAQQEKKISFGFSKIIKKPELNIKAEQRDEKKIDYIKCVDDKSIKVIGEDEKRKDELLIIPMLGTKSWHDRIVSKINDNIQKDIQSKKKDSNDEKNIETNTTELNKNSSLEEQAAQEILNDLKKKKIQTKNESLVIEQASNLPSDTQESTLENYEEIPIEKFGIAMLRGMGWNPDQGIGKNAQVVKSVLPTLRPKGIGLGADKIFQHNVDNSTINDIKLKLEKGSYVKIVAGKLRNNYGIIESFDDDSGRIIVKLASTNKLVSLNEVLVQPITKILYEKNSRVINTSTYEKYENEMKNRTVKDEKLLSNKSGRVTENNVQKNEISMTRENSRISSSSDCDSDDGKNHKKKSKKQIQSNTDKRSYDSERHCDSSEFYRKREKKTHKKEKKRHKDEKYQLHRHKRSKSRTSRR